MFGRPPTNFGPPGPFPGPGQLTPYNMMQPTRAGGFLSRLFGGGAGPRVGGFGGVPGSNLLGMMNPGGGQGFLGTMQNVEKMIKLAQTVKPMIDQYGPMIKNIPSMLDLLKEYKTYSANQEESKDDTNKNESEKKEPKKLDTNLLNEGATKEENVIKQPPKGIKVVPKKANTSKPIQKVEYKKSTPKLYI